MSNYFLRRLAYSIILLAILSATAFILIQLPPGDVVTEIVGEREAMHGIIMSDEEIANLRKQYGIDKPMIVQYARWMGKLLTGNLGTSVYYQRPVAQLLKERVPLTMIITLFTLLFTYIVAIPIAIYSATHQYSKGDYIATFVGFVGMSIPEFLLAVILMFFGLKFFGFTSTGLFSTEFIAQGWSWAKFVDLCKHLPLPVIVIGVIGTCGLIRVLRGTLLDELNKQYVVTARAKGVSELKLLFKYPVRIAINPIMSTIGYSLASIVSGSVIISIVLNLPTTGPLLYNAVVSQDMELAGSGILFLSSLTVIGTFISDILLAVVDPRIRYTK
jgi:peptide/nickel transport system permease protein